MQLRLNGLTLSIATIDDLRQCLEQVHQQQFSEALLTVEDNGPSLTMLVNGKRAWLMCLRHQGDPGFSSRNPHSTNASEATLEFLLGNGQLDEYPAAWTVPLEDALGACEYFFLCHGDQSPAIAWHADSM